MASPTLQDLLDTLLESVAVDSAGVKIGAVRQVYVDDASGKATFATVATGVFSSDAVVPLHGARLLGRELHVDHTRQSVRDSPRPDHCEDGLEPEQETELLEHYGVDPEPRPAGAQTSADPADARAATKAGATAPDRKPETAAEDEPAGPTPAPSPAARPASTPISKGSRRITGA